MYISIQIKVLIFQYFKFLTKNMFDYYKIMVSTETLIIKNRKKIYKFNVLFINDTTVKIYKKEVNIDTDLLKETLNKLYSIYTKIYIESDKSKEQLSEKLVDYMEFIEIINHDKQVEKALIQMVSLIWNNKWILNFNFIKNKIKKFLSDTIEKTDICKYYYMLLFSLDSIEKIKENQEDKYNKKETELDWELDNCFYKDYEEEDFIMDFILFF